MKFTDVNGIIGRARRAVSGSASVQDEEVKNPVKLAEVLRGILRRLSDVEGKQAQKGKEYEVEVGTAAATVSIQHNFNGPVRFSVVFWGRKRAVGSSYPTAGPALVADATSTANTLVLRSSVAGRAIIRVEPSQNGVPL